MPVRVFTSQLLHYGAYELFIALEVLQVRTVAHYHYFMEYTSGSSPVSALTSAAILFASS